MKEDTAGTPAENIFDCLVVGGGPAGMSAAIAASRSGLKTALLEKNRSLGAKLLLTGGGRCNFTNLAETREFIKSYGPGGGFLRHALAQFPPQALCDFLRDNGVDFITEGKNVFARYGSRRVLEMLERLLKEAGVDILYGTRVSALMKCDEGWSVVTPRARFIARRKLILAPGGMTYPSTGSTGDGCEWAERLGHTITPLRPASGPLRLNPNPFASLQGISIDRARIILYVRGKKIGVTEGSLLFTGGGISGPAALEASLRIVRGSQQGDASALSVDFAPDCTEEDLTALFGKMRKEDSAKRLGNIPPLPEIPKRLYRALLKYAGCDADVKVAEVSREDLRAVIETLKRMRLAVSDTGGLAQSMVTVGGVSIKEVDSHTMQSRKQPGIFFAGEFLDLAGPCGGFNLQCAFSTGFLAGSSE